VKRVLARVFGIEGFPGERAVEQEMWSLAESLLPDAKQIGTYIQAQMDLGATLCTRNRPRCGDCPLAAQCVAFTTGRVAQLPTPRPAREIPHRESAMLILRAGPDVLMEKRPPSGIWGGLWCFPEMTVDEDTVSSANIRFGIEAESVSSLGPVEHGFTHYSLTLHPRVVEVKRRPKKLAEPGLLWISVEDALEAAIPKPVKLILEALQAPPLFAENSRAKSAVRTMAEPKAKPRRK
jgi:A/G-specific adenine glycosylase